MGVTVKKRDRKGDTIKKKIGQSGKRGNERKRKRE